MNKTVRLCTLVVLVTLIGASVCAAESAEQILVRMFSYDPHPASAIFAEKVPFNGKMQDFEIVFIENWQASGENGNLKQISFKIQALSDGQVVASSDTIPVTSAKISKGQQIGNVRVGDVGFTADVTDIAKNKGGITDLTVNFKLTYDKTAADSAQKTVISTPTAGGLDFARRLADRAATMPSDKPAAKISMYKRAIMAAPAVGSSPEATAFHSEINQSIISLEKTSPMFAPFKQSTPSFEKVQTASVVSVEPARKSEIPEEAVKLYKEARSLLSQNKGPEGRDALRKALEIAPAYPDALVLLGDNASENRRWARAKDAFKQVLDINDRDADILLKYFKACYYIGEGADAILYLEQIRSKYPNERRIQLAVAEANFQLGDLPAAKVLCEQMLQNDPDDSRAKDLLQRINRLHK